MTPLSDKDFLPTLEHWDKLGVTSVYLGSRRDAYATKRSYITVLGYNERGECIDVFTHSPAPIDDVSASVDQYLDTVEFMANIFNCNSIGVSYGYEVLEGQVWQRRLGSDKVCIINYTNNVAGIEFNEESGIYNVNMQFCLDSVGSVTKELTKGIGSPTPYKTVHDELERNFTDPFGQCIALANLAYLIRKYNGLRLRFSSTHCTTS